jgi:hypothetical protein
MRRTPWLIGAKLGNIIKEKLGLNCIYNNGVMEMCRGVRLQLHGLISKLHGTCARVGRNVLRRGWLDWVICGIVLLVCSRSPPCWRPADCHCFPHQNKERERERNSCKELLHLAWQRLGLEAQLSVTWPSLVNLTLVGYLRERYHAKRQVLCMPTCQEANVGNCITVSSSWHRPLEESFANVNLIIKGGRFMSAFGFTNGNL